MDRQDLRAAQAPLKDRYRVDPDAAITPVGAVAVFARPVTVEVDTHIGPVRAGLHPAVGGDGSAACSADMLMQALAACAGVTLHAVAVASGVELRNVEVRAEAVFDARGTLGVERDAQVGVQRARVIALVETDADDGVLLRLEAATERYCVVAKSLLHPPEFEIRRR